MRSIGTKLGKNYAWELELFVHGRDLKEGCDVFRFNIQGDWYPSDHKPSFEVEWIFCNFTMFRLAIYNIWHADDKRSPMYDKYMEEECKYHGETYEKE